MSQRLEDMIIKIRSERERQLDLPGSEWDINNTPGEWIALISHYVSKEVRKNGLAPAVEDFEESLIKAAAVILAALEYIPNMEQREQLFN